MEKNTINTPVLPFDIEKIMIHFLSGGVSLMKSKRKTIVILILLLLLFGSAIYLYYHSHQKPKIPDNLIEDDNADNWKGDKDLYNPQSEVPMIDIPGITSLVFQPDTTNQKVNFYNPETNDCMFRMTLNVDGKQYWQSGYCAPGKGYYDIELTEPLESGTYSAYLLVECFKEDGTRLNGANVEFELQVR